MWIVHGHFTAEYHNNHLPPTVNSDGNELHIDVYADEESIFYARYYTPASITKGIVDDKNLKGYRWNRLYLI